MVQTLKDIKIDFSKPVHMLCDNTSTINISKNHVQHSRTKHIVIIYHFLREIFLANDVILNYVASNGQVADIFISPYLKQFLNP